MLPKNTHLGRRDLMILVLLFDTAVRVEELVKLKIENTILSVTEPYILVEGKGGKERTVALNSKTIALLKDYMEEFHTGMFRRTRASGLYQDGVDISLISKVLGHIFSLTVPKSLFWFSFTGRT